LNVKILFIIGYSFELAFSRQLDLYYLSWQTDSELVEFRKSIMRGLSNIAESLIKESNLNPTVSDVFVKWNQIVGEELSKYVEPHKVVKMNGSNILIVKTKNCCATEIQHDSLQLIEKLNSYFKNDLFSVVRVIQE